MRKRRLWSIVPVVIVLLLLSGCSKKEDKPQTEDNLYPEPGSKISSDVWPVNELLALWNVNKKDEAVKEFLSIQWDDPSVFQGADLLNLSEKEFVSLPTSERTRIKQDAFKLERTLRVLGKHVLSTGEKFAASGDTDMANAHFEAVLRYGRALSKPERLAIIQLSGKAMVKAAQSKLPGG